MQRNAYRMATALILVGFGMLCQPFGLVPFSAGFPVLVAGVVLFLILDHVPAGVWSRLKVQEPGNGTDG